MKVIYESPNNMELSEVTRRFLQRILTSATKVSVKVLTTRADDILNILNGAGFVTIFNEELGAAGLAYTLDSNTAGTSTTIPVQQESDSVPVYPNLTPGPWDLDMDVIDSSINPHGLQLPPSNDGETLTLTIRLNAEEGQLHSWDMFM